MHLYAAANLEMVGITMKILRLHVNGMILKSNYEIPLKYSDTLFFSFIYGGFYYEFN